MNISKTIKKQALSYLANDNWATAVGGFFIICLPVILLILFQSMALSLLGIFKDLDNLTFTDSCVIFIFELLLITAFVFSIPMITGYLKLCYNISKGEEAKVSDIFYFYSGNRFGKCLSVNFSVIIRLFFHFLLVNIPTIIMAGLFITTQYYSFFVLAIIFFCGALIDTIFYGVKFTVVPVVMFEDESLSDSDVIRYGTYFISDKLKSTRTLLLTFFPYFLLCFFVIPWIFVFPYVIVSLMTNGKWISELNKAE